MMLDHLDDPVPFIPSAELSAAVASRGRRLRRRRRAVGVSVSALVLLGGVTVAGALYVERRDAAIDRVDISTQPSTDGATNVLLAGLDGRSGEPRHHADTMVVVRFDTDGRVRLLPIPRDLWDDPGGQRVNAAGGGQAQVDAVTRATGIPIDHLVELRFDGFRALIDDLGGLPVRVTAPLRDGSTGLRLDPSACARLDGGTALALARSRHLQHQDQGDWHADPRADLGRTARGQVLIRAMITGLAEAGTSPGRIDDLSRTLADHATLDSGLSIRRLAELAGKVADAEPDDVVSDALPVETVVRPDGANVLQLAGGAEDVVDRYGASASVPETFGDADPLPAGPELIAPC
jgi:LCP family protein required for cell wall assembly